MINFIIYIIFSKIFDKHEHKFPKLCIWQIMKRNLKGKDMFVIFGDYRLRTSNSKIEPKKEAHVRGEKTNLDDNTKYVVIG